MEKPSFSNLQTEVSQSMHISIENLVKPERKPKLKAQVDIEN